MHNNRHEEKPENKLERLSSCPLCRSVDMVEIDKCSNLFRCNACGYVFDNPRPNLTALKEYYSQPAKYEGWVQTSRERDLLWKRRLKKILGWKRNGAILDIGTGIGQFLHHAQRRHG